MADSIYTLAVRLAFEAPNIATIATMAMRQFSQVEKEASRLDSTVMRLTGTMRQSAQGAMYGASLGTTTKDMATVERQAKSMLGTFEMLNEQNVLMGGKTGITHAQAFTPFIQNVDKAKESVRSYRTELRQADQDVARLQKTIYTMERVSPNIGIPGSAYARGTVMPSVSVNAPIPDNTQTRRYQLLSEQYAAAQARAGTPTAPGPARLNLQNAESFLNFRNTQLTGALFTAASTVQNQATLIEDAEKQRLAAAEARMQRGQNMALAGGLGMMVSGIGIPLIGDAVRQAGQYQLVQTQIQQAMRGGLGRDMTDSETQDMFSKFMDVGQIRGFGATQMGQIALGLTKVGINSPKLLNQIIEPVTDFAEVMARTRNEAPGLAATQTGEFAHQFGVIQSPKDFRTMVDLLSRTSMVTAVTNDQILRTMSYTANPLRGMYGIHLLNEPAGPGRPAVQRSSQKDIQKWMQDSMTMAALIAWTGQQPRGGSQLSSLLKSMIGTPTTRNAQQFNALESLQNRLKIHVWDKSGRFEGVDQLLSLLQAAGQTKDPRRSLMAMQLITGAVGGHIAANLGADTTKQMQSLIKNSLGNINDIAQIQKAFNQTGAGSYAQLQAAMQNLSIIIGTALLPALTMVAKATGGIINQFNRLGTSAVGRPIMTVVVWLASLALAVTYVLAPFAILRGTLLMLGLNFTKLLLPLRMVASGFLDFLSGLALGARPLAALAAAFPNVAKVVGGFFGVIRGGIGLIVRFFGLFLRLGPVLRFLVSPLGLLIRLVPVLVEAFVGLGAAILGLLAPVWVPVVIGIGLVAVAVGGLILLFTHWQQITSAVHDLTLGIVKLWQDFWNGIGGKIGDFLGLISGTAHAEGLTTHAGAGSGSGKGKTVPPKPGETQHDRDAANKAALLLRQQQSWMTQAAVGKAAPPAGKTQRAAALTAAQTAQAQRLLDAHNAIMGTKATAKTTATPGWTPRWHTQVADGHAKVPAKTTGTAVHTTHHNAGGVTIVQNFHSPLDAYDPRKIKKATQDAMSEVFQDGNRYYGNRPGGLQVGKNGY